VQKTTARSSIIRVALTAGKGGSRETERWLSPPGLGALRARNIHFAKKWVNIDVKNMSHIEIQLLVRVACFLEKEAQKENTP